MSEILEFRWPEGVPDKEDFILTGDEEQQSGAPAWTLPAEPPEGGAGPPPSTEGDDDDDLYLYVRVDRTVALKRVEELERAYAGALSVIDAQRRRMLVLQRQLEETRAHKSRRRSK